MGDAKTISQRRKVLLWKYSSWLIICVLTIAVNILIFSFWIKAYVIGDLLTDIAVILAIMFHFW
jgi:hypothetical protein